MTEIPLPDPNSTPMRGLILPLLLRDEIRSHIIQALPEEACGIAAGRDNLVNLVIPITNQLHSPVRFHMEPNEQLQAFEKIDENGLELLAIYHSHPMGLDQPSSTDIAEAYYPDAIYLIWFPDPIDWNCRGFMIQEGDFHEVPIRLTHQE